jgi:hypothetical protein
LSFARSAHPTIFHALSFVIGKPPLPQSYGIT